MTAQKRWLQGFSRQYSLFETFILSQIPYGERQAYALILSPVGGKFLKYIFSRTVVILQWLIAPVSRVRTLPLSHIIFMILCNLFHLLKLPFLIHKARILKAPTISRDYCYDQLNNMCKIISTLPSISMYSISVCYKLIAFM